MIRFYLVFAFVFCVTAKNEEKKDEVCYGDLGCFNTGPPFRSDNRPIPIPGDPKDYPMSFEFFTRHSNVSSLARLYPDIEFTSSRFRKDRPYTIFILAGVGQIDKDLESWKVELKDAILDRVDANIFLTKSSTLFLTFDVFTIAAITPVFAAQIARFIDYLKEKKGIKSEQIWLIGSGVGAHTGGFIGNRTKVGRITGLDPAQELYENQPKEIHLDADDADFVDIIHSDSRPLVPDLGYGFIAPLGDVDFYINGGHQQPGCKIPKPFEVQKNFDLLQGVKEGVRITTQILICAHKYAHRVFIQTFRNKDCTFWGHPYSKENHLKGISNAASEGILLKYTALTDYCTITTCVPMGLDAPKSPLRGVFIVTTSGTLPYCLKSTEQIQEDVKNEKLASAFNWFSGIFKSGLQKADNLFR